MGSALFHLVVFFLMFSSAAGDPVSAAGGGGPTGPLINVTLVGPFAAQAPSQAIEGGDLAPLFAKYRSRPGDTPIPFAPTPQSRAFTKLIDRFQTSTPTSTRQAQVDFNRRDAFQRAPVEASTQEAPTPSPGKQSAQASTGETKGSASTGELWGRIEPCWRNLSPQVGRPVTLEVAIDALGSMSRPPKVLRSVDATLDEPRLRAEAKALAALAACLPRGDLRFARQVYRLDFVAP